MPDLSLREKLDAVVQSGKEAERALEKLEVLEVAEGEEATVADFKAAVEVAEAEGDMNTARVLKGRWADLLRGFRDGGR